MQSAKCKVSSRKPSSSSSVIRHLFRTGATMIDKQRLVDLFLEMCRVNTPALHERVLIDLIQPRLEDMGLQCVRDDAHTKSGGDSGNLIATLPANVDGALPIFFSSHFDTVAPNPSVQIV